MMDFQQLLDIAAAGDFRTRGQYHVTLGKLIHFLNKVHPELKVVIRGTNNGIRNPHSYRGYYSDLAFELSDSPIEAGDLLKIAKECLGSTYEGYKGGEYEMKENTPLWLADYGHTGLAIVAMEATLDNVLLTAVEID